MPLGSIFHIITGLGIGGAEASLFRLVGTDKSHRHVVLSLMDEGLYGIQLRSIGIKTICLHMSRGKITPLGLIKLYQLLKEERPDVVQTWLYHADLIGGLIARLAGVKAVVWNIRNFSLDPLKVSRSTRFVARLCALLSHFVPSAIISCSQQAAYAHQRHGYSKKRMAVISNGYEISRFPFSSDNCDVSENRIVFGMVARWDPLKDHKNLVEALVLFASSYKKNWKCVLVGVGIDKKNGSLLSLLENSGLEKHIQLLGPQENVSGIMSTLDMHVLSSCSEAFPNVVAESMACGVPNVVTDVGDASMIVGDTGWVVPPSQPSALAGALMEAALARDNFTSWEQRRKRCRERIAQNFSMERMVSSYQKVWNDVANTEGKTCAASSDI